MAVTFKNRTRGNNLNDLETKTEGEHTLPPLNTNESVRPHKDSLLMSQTQRFGDSAVVSVMSGGNNYASPGAMIQARPNLLTRFNQSRGTNYGNNNTPNKF